jgi:hypothetical protein
MTDRKPVENDEVATRNRGLQEEEKRQNDPDSRTTHRKAEQSAPEPERPPTPDETSDQDIAQLENPPQAEGPRERSNDAV